MIKLNRKEDCCGCNSCGDICPKKAIRFVEDNEGFLYPEISQELCINCGLCEKICPVINTCKDKECNYAEPECYAAEHKSIDVIFSSTTGGMFTALADVMYNQDGYVGGAIHNEDFTVSHFISNDKSDLVKLRRSKDLQSNAEGFYAKVGQLIKDGKKVLVCGVPCQIAAVKNFLMKDYENLITVEVICAGVNSPKVWLKYLSYIEEINGSKIVYTENKSKEYGWKNLTQKFLFENGNEYFDTVKTSLFTQSYIQSHLYCRPSCYDCKFKGFPRNADITIGDFWGLTQHNQKYNKDMGTNVVFINSEKGKQYFDIVKKRINCEKQPLEWAISGNPRLNTSITQISDKRDEFFEDLDKYRFDEVVKMYSVKPHKTIKGLIKGFLMPLKKVYKILKLTQYSPKALFQTLKYSGVKNLIHGKGIVCTKHCILNIDKTSHLRFDGLLILGNKGKFPKSKLESRLFIGKNASFEVLGNFSVDFDCNIEVFDMQSL